VRRKCVMSVQSVSEVKKPIDSVVTSASPVKWVVVSASLVDNRQPWVDAGMG